MSKRKSTSRKSRRPLAGTGLQDIVDSGQQLISEAQERASVAAKQVQKVASDAVSTLEKRRDVELKNLRARLKDLSTAVGGLERRYRSLETRLTKQIETISGRTVKASDLDKRIRAVESEIRRAAGLGRSGAGSARATSSRTATRAQKATSTARRKGAATATRSASRRASGTSATAKKSATAAKRKTTAASKTARRRATGAATTARKTARTAPKRASGAARSVSRTVSAAAKAASTTATTAAKAVSTGAAKGTTSARRSAAGSAGGRAKAKRSTTRKPAAKKPAPGTNSTS